jgi:hypothetical protein
MKNPNETWVVEILYEKYPHWTAGDKKNFFARDDARKESKKLREIGYRTRVSRYRRIEKEEIKKKAKSRDASSVVKPQANLEDQNTSTNAGLETGFISSGGKTVLDAG